MKLIRYVSLFIFAALLCSITLAQDVFHTDYDRKVNFEQFHTYSWGKVQLLTLCGNRGSRTL